MKLRIGIDEAGYGPTLGPLVLGLVGLRTHDDESRDSYQLLRRWVGRCADAGDQRLAVDDSKKLFAGRRSLAKLETSALSFARPGRQLPDDLEDLCGAFAVPAPDDWPGWYRRTASPELPLDAERQDVAEWRARIEGGLAEEGIDLVECRAVPILEPGFNESLAKTGNKAASLMSFVAPLIQELPRRFPDDAVEIRIDRLGGRRYYGEFLSSLYPFQPLQIVQESASHSEYVIREGGRDLRVSFETKADGRHFGVALASVAAKYVREVFLRRLNAHFLQRLPSLKPTAGYPEDAGRFLDDISPFVSSKERGLLIRVR